MNDGAFFGLLLYLTALHPIIFSLSLRLRQANKTLYKERRRAAARDAALWCILTLSACSPSLRGKRLRPWETEFIQQNVSLYEQHGGVVPIPTLSKREEVQE